MSPLNRKTLAFAVPLTAILLFAPLAAQQAEVTINDTMVSPESVTSSRDGAIIFGSTAKGTVYRAAPGAAAADAWIQASTAGLQRVLGVFADDRSQTLWVCSSAPAPARGATPPATPTGETGVKSFNLATGAAKGSFAFPGGTGTCNDMAVAADGTMYATDTSGARVLRLRPGATTMDLWAADPLLNSADGIALLADGAVYVNTFGTGTLVKIGVGAGGAAVAPMKLETSRPLVRPDGMRSVNGGVMLLIEGDGHLDEVTIQGNRAEIKTLKDGFMGPTAVTLVGNQAYVLEGRTKVTAVPYTAPQATGAPAGRQGGPPAGGRGAAFTPGPGRSNNPFPTPISATDGVIKVNYTEFASIPEAGTDAARMNLLLDEPGTRRMFVNTMQGMLYSVSYDGKTVTPYLDINDAKWGNPVQSLGSERGFQSFAFHPQFAQRGTPGYGKFYTYADTTNMTPMPDFVPLGTGHTHDLILQEWTAKDPRAAKYDGDGPREMFRVAHPFANHNGGEIAFNPTARPGSADFGLLYIGSADGGSGGDPYNHAQNLKSAFGKILRIDPLGRNSANKKYGIPASNPFAKNADALGEVYRYGHRNPQRFSWDPKSGRMFEAEIGQNINEEINQIVAGGNYGWNIWEGSFKYFNREVGIEDQRSDAKMIYPIAEFDHTDPLFPSTRLSATGIYVYREKAIKGLTDTLIFGDNPSGEVFYVNADKLPSGGQNFHRVLFNDKGEAKILLDIIKAKNTQQGKMPAPRADMRMGVGPNGQLFILNKHDGVIRLLVP